MIVLHLVAAFLSGGLFGMALYDLLHMAPDKAAYTKREMWMILIIVGILAASSAFALLETARNV